MSRTIVRDHSTYAQWEVTLQVNEYLLRDGRIQNTTKYLR